MGRRGEITGLRRDGSEFPTEASISCFETDGEVVYTAVLRDITGRQAMERALREREELYRLLADNATDMIVRMASDGRQLYVSPGCRDVLGYDPAELLGTSAWELVHPEDRDHVRQAFASVESSRERRSATYRGLRKDGRHAWLEATLRLTTDPATGERQGFVTVIRDVSERKAWEVQLAASEQKHRAILDTCTDTILLADAATGRIKEANGHAAQLFGCPAQDLIGLHQTELHPDADRERFRLTFREHVDVGRVQVHDAAIKRRDGTEVPVEITARPTVIGGEQILVGFFRDITHRKEREAALVAARAAAEAANEAKTLFLANMSHELRTPLNAVIGFSDLIASQALGPVGLPRYVEYACDIRDSGQHLLELINDILDHAKAEAGQLALDESRVDLAAAVEFAARLISPRAQRAGVVVEDSVAPEVRWVVADERRLRQILLNLLSNAVKFTPAGGRITLTAELAAEDAIRITVADTGVGIAAQDLSRVLEPFVQAAGGREGTGLGLPLTKRLVEMHGGALALDSRPGQGTVVTVTLPAMRRRLPPAPVASRGEGAGGPHVLVVEDDGLVRLGVVGLLQGFGYRVSAAANANEALTVLQGRDPIDLLFTDLVMPPGMSGAELAAEATRRQPGLKVLLTSGFAGHAVVGDEGTSRDFAFIAKPYAVRDLRQAIERVLGASPGSVSRPTEVPATEA